MDSKQAAVFLCLSFVYMLNKAHVNGEQNVSDVNVTKIRPYDKFRALEMTRAQVLKKTTFHTVCRPRVIPTGSEIIITDMTIDSRVGKGDTNYEFAMVKKDHTFGTDTDVMESTVVENTNDCVTKCCSNPDCKTYVYHYEDKVCKLTKACRPNLVPSVGTQVFSMTYWY